MKWQSVWNAPLYLRLLNVSQSNIMKIFWCEGKPVKKEDRFGLKISRTQTKKFCQWVPSRSWAAYHGCKVSPAAFELVKARTCLLADGRWTLHLWDNFSDTNYVPGSSKTLEALARVEAMSRKGYTYVPWLPDSFTVSYMAAAKDGEWQCASHPPLL